MNSACKTAIRYTLTGFSLLLFSAAKLCACPTCKDSIGPGDENLAQAYGWSIVFMMAMPFLIFGSLGTYLYIEIRRARRLQAAAESQAAMAVAVSEQQVSVEEEPIGV